MNRNTQLELDLCKIAIMHLRDIPSVLPLTQRMVTTNRQEQFVDSVILPLLIYIKSFNEFRNVHGEPSKCKIHYTTQSCHHFFLASFCLSWVASAAKLEASLAMASALFPSRLSFSPRSASIARFSIAMPAALSALHKHLFTYKQTVGFANQDAPDFCFLPMNLCSSFTHKQNLRGLMHDYSVSWLYDFFKHES